MLSPVNRCLRVGIGLRHDTLSGRAGCPFQGSGGCKSCRLKQDHFYASTLNPSRLFSRQGLAGACVVLETDDLDVGVESDSNKIPRILRS